LRQRAGSFARLATPIRVWVQRFAFLLLATTAAGLIIMSQAQFPIAERLRTRVVDAFAPILESLSRPVDTVSGWIDYARDLNDARSENLRLRAEVAQLKHWESEVLRLQAENESLRNLVGIVPENEARHIGARVIADSGGAFVRSLIINAGARNGVRKGVAVVNDEGLVGRVTQVGERAARVLLVTDLNSRIPIVIQGTRDRAILAGDNSDNPQLVHLPAGAPVSPGDRIVTSGHGGVFPPGIGIGVISSVDDAGIRVRPFVQWHRLEHVRVVDYDPQGILMGTSALRSHTAEVP